MAGDAKAEADGFPLIESFSVQYNESLPDGKSPGYSYTVVIISFHPPEARRHARTGMSLQRGCSQRKSEYAKELASFII